MNTGQQEIVREVVLNYFNNYAITYIPYTMIVSEKNHIIEIGTSILCTKWNVGYPGGSFVQAIVNNNLSESFNKADYVNLQCILFYVMLMCNVEPPTILFE